MIDKKIRNMELLKTILSLAVTAAIALLIYCWISLKFLTLDEITTYEYEDRNNYVAWVSDPLHLFLISYGESEKSEGEAIARAKEKHRTKTLLWSGISAAIAISSEYLRRRINKKK